MWTEVCSFPIAGFLPVGLYFIAWLRTIQLLNAKKSNE